MMCVGKKTQKGAALIISLVVLAVVTVLGVTSMQSSNQDLLLAENLRDRNITFEAAEAALVVVESHLADNPPVLSDLLNGCTGDTCFNSRCENGLCFSGVYDVLDDQIYCQVRSPNNSVSNKPFWSDTVLNVWENHFPATHKKLNIDSVDAEIKYITEFLCFVEKNSHLPFSIYDGERNNGAPLFRITVLVESHTGREKVSLQSTYKLLSVM